MSVQPAAGRAPGQAFLVRAGHHPGPCRASRPRIREQCSHAWERRRQRRGNGGGSSTSRINLLTNQGQSADQSVNQSVDGVGASAAATAAKAAAAPPLCAVKSESIQSVVTRGDASRALPLKLSEAGGRGWVQCADLVFKVSFCKYPDPMARLPQRRPVGVPRQGPRA
jgi:hypothetical protein